MKKAKKKIVYLKCQGKQRKFPKKFCKNKIERGTEGLLNRKYYCRECFQRYRIIEREKRSLERLERKRQEALSLKKG
jgi:hypothetical protein